MQRNLHMIYCAGLRTNLKLFDGNQVSSELVPALENDSIGALPNNCKIFVRLQREASVVEQH